MEFSTRDFESTIAANVVASNSAVNVQPKKQFNLADVDSNDMKLENDDWNIDSIFPLNNDFLNDFNDLADMNMDTNWTDAYDYMSSPISTGTESENDHEVKFNVNQMLSPPQNLVSSSSSDSGLSSDHVEFDMSLEQLGADLLQPTQIVPQLIKTEQVHKTINQVFEDKLPIESTLLTSSKTATQNSSEAGKFRITNANHGQGKECSFDNGLKQKAKLVKKMPSQNVVHIVDSSIRSNRAVAGENIVANTPIVINKVNANISGIRKVIQLKKNPNQKPIILPFNLKNGGDIRSIKIIKPSSLTKSPKILMAASNLLQEYKQHEMKQNTIIINKPFKIEPKYEHDSMSEPSDCESYKFEEMIVQDEEYDADEYNNDSDQGVEIDQHSEYPKLILSGEEKRLLAKEGIALPAHYPLTKHEERELKRIRRKIRNKISAQDSRKRKKEYVDGLEERVKKCTDENQTLLKRIKLLQSQNQNLINQMKKMQSLLTKGGNKSVQPATCLMVLLMSMALIAAPNLKLNKDNPESAITQEIMEENNVQQNRRTLLYDSKDKFSDLVADEEVIDFGMFNDKIENNNEHNYAELQKPLSGLIDNVDVDDSVWLPKRNNSRGSPLPKLDIEIENIKTSSESQVWNDLSSFADISETVTHTKLAKDINDTQASNSFQADNLKNIIKLNAEVDAKNV